MNNFIFLSVISVILSIMLAWQISRKYDNEKRYTCFVRLMLAVANWSVFALLEVIMPGQYKILFSKLSYFGIVSVPVLWLLFSLEYTNLREIIKNKKTLYLWILPFITLIFVMTNEYHGLFWSKIYPYATFDNVILYKYERGIIYTINLIYSYILLLLGLIIIFSNLNKTKVLKNYQIIIIGVLAPIIANILYMTRFVHLDYAPAAFSFTCLCFSWAIVKGFFERNMAIAESIHESIKEGIILIDKNYKIINVNPCAERIIGTESIKEGIDAKEVIIFWEELKSKLSQNNYEYFEVCINKEYYGINVYRISKESKISGWIVSMLDITERKNSEEALKLMSGLLSGTAEATSMLLDGKDCRKSIYDAIQIIGKAAKVDRAYLFGNTYNNDSQSYVTSQKFEWAADSCEAQIDNPLLQNLPFEEVAFFIEPLSKGQIFCEVVSELIDKSLKEILESQNIKSILVLPLFVRDSFWGFVGFDDCTKDRKWTSDEEAILRTFANSISRAIERGIIENELEEGRKKAEAANIAKSNFLANMSHEIRTPMNGITGFVDILMKTALTKEQLDYLTEVHKASETLLYIINDVLDLSKIEADKMILENIKFNIHNMVEDSVSLFAPRAYDKHIGLYSEIRAGVPSEAEGDPGRLRQVLNNLIGNAVKFTNKGEVTVIVEKLKETEDKILIAFSVSDTGIGMSEEMKANLFKPFTQGDSSTTRKYGGTGLGLAISKKIIELMGGSITVRSKEQEGTVFNFEIEFKKPNNVENINYGELKGLNILIVDDNNTNRRIFKEYLKEEGCNVIEIESGVKVIEMVNDNMLNNDIDIAIIDYNMPGMNGIELGQKMREIEAFSKTKIIIASSSAQAEDGLRVKDAGFRGYISKPIKRKDLLDIISAVAGCEKVQDADSVITKHMVREDSVKDKKIFLLVEDTEVNRKLVLILLKKLGYECEVAVNGKDAVAICSSKKYDLIFMDCQMPIMDGYEATRLIKAKNGMNSNTPIIAMTANALKGDKEACLEAGMDDYLAKPINLKIIEEIIGKWLDILKEKQ